MDLGERKINLFAHKPCAIAGSILACGHVQADSVTWNTRQLETDQGDISANFSMTVSKGFDGLGTPAGEDPDHWVQFKFTPPTGENQPC